MSYGNYCNISLTPLVLTLARINKVILFSGMDVTDTEGTVGLYVHELLHNLGVGNTDKHGSSEHVPLLCSEHVPLLCTIHPGWAHSEAA